MTAKVKAAVLLKPKTLELREFPRPAIGPDDALLRIEACGICGSDYEQYDGAQPPHEDYTSFPVVPGHEPLGRIEEIGAAGEAALGRHRGRPRGRALRVWLRPLRGLRALGAHRLQDARGHLRLHHHREAAPALGRVRGAHVPLPALRGEEDRRAHLRRGGGDVQSAGGGALLGRLRPEDGPRRIAWSSSARGSAASAA